MQIIVKQNIKYNLMKQNLNRTKKVGNAAHSEKLIKISYKLVMFFNNSNIIKVFQETDPIDARRKLYHFTTNLNETVDRANDLGLINQEENQAFSYSGFEAYCVDELSGVELLISEGECPRRKEDLSQADLDADYFTDPDDENNAVFLLDQESGNCTQVGNFGFNTEWQNLDSEYKLYEKYSYDAIMNPLTAVTSDGVQFKIINPESMSHLFYITDFDEYQTIVKDGIIANREGYIYFSNDHDLHSKRFLHQAGLCNPFVVLEIDNTGINEALQYDNLSADDNNHRHRVQQVVIYPAYVRINSIKYS